MDRSADRGFTSAHTPRYMCTHLISYGLCYIRVDVITMTCYGWPHCEVLCRVC